MKDPKKISYYFKKEWPLVILIILFGISFNVSLVFQNIYIGKVIDTIIYSPIQEVIVKTIVIFLLVMLEINITRFGKRYTIRLFSNKTEKRMKKIIYDNIINKSLEDFKKEDMGDLMTKSIGDVQILCEGIRKAVVEVFDTGVMIIASIVILSIYDYKIALMGLIMVPILVIFATLLKKPIYKATRNYRKTQSEVFGNTYELINHTLIYRGHNSLDEEIKEYNNDLKKLKKSSIKSSLFEGTFEPLYKIISYFGLFFVVYFAAKNVLNEKPYINGIWTVGVFTAFIKNHIELLRKSSRISLVLNILAKSKISYKRVLPYLEFIDVDKEFNGYKISNLAVNDLNITIDNNKIINNLSFSAKIGEIIGVTGVIASGKSTLGLALSGVINYNGSIKLNDLELNNIHKLDKSSLISYLGHNPYLISDSIKNNITFGNKRRIDNVLDLVDFKKDFLDMPDKYETLVGSNGVRLSGGQGQRIALARALYNNKPLIILDDPFSASDMKTESKIIENIKNNYKDSIIILISHRLTIFPYVDKVIMLDDEILVLPHNEMLEKSNKYRLIYNAQRNEARK